MWTGNNGEIAVPLDGSYYKGCGFRAGEERTVVYWVEDKEEEKMVIYPKSTTGTLMASGYNKPGTQEALNDMYVVEASAYNGDQVSPTLTSNNAGGNQRMPDKGNFNAVIQSAYAMKAFGQYTHEETSSAMKARDYKDATDLVVSKEEDSGMSNNMIVRRLTPKECERLQGFPVVRNVKFSEMTKDEYIAYNINEGHIIVDKENGKVFATRGPGGITLDTPRELTGSSVNGYLVVSIRNGNTKMQCRIHRIVWISEHGIIPDGYVVDHINNNKQDNRICNLQLLKQSENSTKARADGLYKVHDDAGTAKISDETHDLIQYVYGNTDLTIRQLSDFFGISKSRVQQIVHEEPWTDIGEWVDSNGKKHKEADSPRYKALGNSIALPFWEWMAGRICAQYDRPITMGSLFDGIGGFPLAFQRHGAEPVWASEIEEFCIAVTKERFPEAEDQRNEAE